MGIIFGEYVPSIERTEYEKVVTVGVFFDGTLNNRKNTRARKTALEEETDANPSLSTVVNKDGTSERNLGISAFNKEKDVSYFNDESNVSRLERFYEKDDALVLKVYVEGIGTDNFEGDAFLSKTTGAFSRGIGDKVSKACKKIVEKLNILNYDAPKSRIIDILQFDIYGFSRGAAAARHFIYQVMRTDKFTLEADIITGFTIDPHPTRGYLGQYLYDQKISVYEVKIRFVGLYETVASYGIIHWNDVFQLKLDKLYYADKVVHLTAQDEIRENFSLIDITSAGKKGVTITMPGVHSDIGGGYEENIKQEKVLLWDGKRKKFDTLTSNRILYHYLLEGWFNKKTIDKERMFQLFFLRNEVYGKRQNITNTYSVIPLQIMAKLSNDNKALIETKKLEEFFNTNDDGFLSSIQKKLFSQLKNSTGNIVELLKFDRLENAENIWKKMVEKYYNKGTEYTHKSISKSQFKEYYYQIKKDKKALLRECDLFIENSSELEELIKNNWKLIRSYKNDIDDYTPLKTTKKETIQENLGDILDISKTFMAGTILDEVVVIAYKKDIDNIKKLRNIYLHISHTYENSALFLEPLAPSFDYMRKYRKG